MSGRSRFQLRLTGLRLTKAPESFQHCIEESPKLKRKSFLAILALVAAAFMPLAATSQIAPDRPPRAENTEPATKYEVYAGVGYTSLNNVNQSRNGLLGVNVTVTRDWGKFFGLTANGGMYQHPYDSTNPGNPTVDMLLLGPTFHGHLYGNLDGFVHALLGIEHISGTSSTPGLAYSTPSISLAGGLGIGLEYKLTPRFALRAWGDDILSSFAANTNQAVCTNGGCLSHESRSARASFGLVYKF